MSETKKGKKQTKTDMWVTRAENSDTEPEKHLNMFNSKQLP